jgi:hypothetical protein
MSAQFKGLRVLISFAAAAVLIAGVTVSALAEDQAEDDNRLDEAWKDAIGDQENNSDRQAIRNAEQPRLPGGGDQG